MGKSVKGGVNAVEKDCISCSIVHSPSLGCTSTERPGTPGLGANMQPTPEGEMPKGNVSGQTGGINKTNGERDLPPGAVSTPGGLLPPPGAGGAPDRKPGQPGPEQDSPFTRRDAGRHEPSCTAGDPIDVPGSFFRAGSSISRPHLSIRSGHTSRIHGSTGPCSRGSAGGNNPSVPAGILPGRGSSAPP